MKSLLIVLFSLTLLVSNVFATQNTKKDSCHCSCKTHAHVTKSVNDQSGK